MEVISTRRYEARPPADSHASILVDPANAVATVKEEEWETRKKKEITTTRQIETRVKRQVVLEDGEVVVDSGPLVTTNTTEDVEQQEHTTQERRTTGDEPQKVDWPAGAKPGAAVVQKELNETVVKSREEIEELLETEDRQQLGDISDEAYLLAVRKNRGDLRAALAAESRRQPVSTGPRVLQHTTRSNKVVDTEKTLERSELKQGGQIVTERKTTVEHEEIKDDELPASAEELEEGRERRKEATQRYVKTRDEDIVDYVVNGERVGREMRFVSETTEAERTGEWPAAEALRGPRLGKHGFPAAPAASPGSRKDAVTRQPLDLEEEDEARKFETSKWLESHFGSESLEDGDEPAGHTAGHTASYINVTMKSACPPRESLASQQRSAEPAGYFHGISEWSERYHSTEKQQSSYNARTKSPSQYVAEAPRREQQQQQQKQRRPSPPSPPARRRQQQQPPPRPQEAPQPERPSSPVHVVQRTWESRSREERRAESPPAPPGDERQRPSKSPSPAKYKIGESFRKLVGKLRSASSERRGKRPAAGSSSQLTQTDEGSTYLQYNSVDRNVPLGPDYEPEERPPERPPRSPRNPAGNPPSLGVKGRYRSSRSGSPRHAPDEPKEPRSAHQPIHRYYLGEDPYGGSIYGREKGYRETKLAHSNRHRIRPTEDEYSAESSSLGRFSKSTSRLGQELEQNEYERTNAQTLPRKIQHTSTPTRNHQQQTTTTTTTTTSRRMTNGHGNSARFNNSSSSSTTTNNITNNNNNNNTNNNKNYSYDSPNRQYGSLINISFKNTVNTPAKATHFVQTTINTQPPPPPPLKPERTYKSTLSRSKSFNVEIADDGVITTPRNTTYSNNIRSSSQLNKLNETPPLKSPGILASISRSNRDLLRNGKLDY